jgi:hypothetical protein
MGFNWAFEGLKRKAQVLNCGSQTRTAFKIRNSSLQVEFVLVELKTSLVECVLFDNARIIAMHFNLSAPQFYI